MKYNILILIFLINLLLTGCGPKGMSLSEKNVWLAQQTNKNERIIAANSKEECYKQNLYPELFNDGTLMCRSNKEKADSNTIKNIGSKEYAEILFYRNYISVAVLNEVGIVFDDNKGKFIAQVNMSPGDRKKLLLPGGKYRYRYIWFDSTKGIDLEVENGKQYCVSAGILLTNFVSLENCLDN